MEKSTVKVKKEMFLKEKEKEKQRQEEQKDEQKEKGIFSIWQNI